MMFPESNHSLLSSETGVLSVTKLEVGMNWKVAHHLYPSNIFPGLPVMIRRLPGHSSDFEHKPDPMVSQSSFASL